MSAAEQKLPDPWQTAKAQQKMQETLNLQTTRLNRPNQITPWGNTTWDAGKRTQTQVLPPAVQAALTAQQQTGAQLAGIGQGMIPSIAQTYASPLSTAGMQPWQALNYESLGSMPSASDATRQSVQDALYSRFTTAMNPQYQQQQNALQANLASQGLTQGSAVYGQETGNFLREKNASYLQALNDAIIGGGDEMARQFGMQMQARQQGANELSSSAQFNNQLRQNQLSEAGYLRGLPLQELNALMGFGNVTSPEMPGFSQSPASSAPDYTGLVSQNYAAQLSNNAANNAMYGQLAGAGINAATSNAALKGYEALAKRLWG